MFIRSNELYPLLGKVVLSIPYPMEEYISSEIIKYLEFFLVAIIDVKC